MEVVDEEEVETMKESVDEGILKEEEEDGMGTMVNQIINNNSRKDAMTNQIINNTLEVEVDHIFSKEAQGIKQK